MGGKMFTILYFILLCFKIFIAYEPYRASHIRATSFETVDSGYALQNHVIEVVHEYSPLDCGFACLQTADCQSYNTRQESSDVYECEMSSSTKTHHPNDFTAVAGVTYYGSDMFPGLGCAVVVCPNKNCRETKTYPYYHCPDDGFDLKFPSTRNHSAKGDDSSSLDEVSICFWCKTSQVKAPFLSYENNGHPPSLLNLVYSDGYVTLQINNKTA
ncbi:Hypothetical predicted protein [Paramuricea clavata]|uniref:Uncharacterized protein n=1 Tax=Paramuricea clavata TaxID=317549 RepID=A0A6S7GDA1_PARCT|nr:Hypothetical predicted protein [Paramuricea clavata]